MIKNIIFIEKSISECIKRAHVNETFNNLKKREYFTFKYEEAQKILEMFYKYLVSFNLRDELPEFRYPSSFLFPIVQQSLPDIIRMKLRLNNYNISTSTLNSIKKFLNSKPTSFCLTEIHGMINILPIFLKYIFLAPTIKTLIIPFNANFNILKLLVNFSKENQTITSLIFKEKLPDNFSTFLSTFSSMPSAQMIESFKFINSQFTRQDVNILSKTLNRLNITSLHMIKSISPHSLPLFLDIIYNNPNFQQIKKLSIDHSLIMDIRKIVPYLQNVTSLTLTCCQFQIADFFSVLNYDCQLEYLNISGNINDKQIFNQITFPCHLSTLILNTIEWDEMSLKIFFECLMAHKSEPIDPTHPSNELKIDISNASMNEDDWALFFNQLELMPRGNIVGFKWNDNPISKQFIHFISSLKNLRSLSLNGCSIRNNDDLNELLQFIVKSQTLENFSFAGTEINNMGKQILSIIDTLYVNRSIKIIDISNNNCGDSILVKLCDVLLENRVVEQVFFDNNKITSISLYCQLFEELSQRGTPLFMNFPKKFVKSIQQYGEINDDDINKMKIHYDLMVKGNLNLAIPINKSIPKKKFVMKIYNDETDNVVYDQNSKKRRKNRKKKYKANNNMTFNEDINNDESSENKKELNNTDSGNNAQINEENIVKNNKASENENKSIDDDENENENDIENKSFSDNENKKYKKRRKRHHKNNDKLKNILKICLGVNEDSYEYYEEEKYEYSLNDFILLKKIGQGGFGKVYKVKEKKSREIYAAKVSLEEICEDSEDILNDISREVNILSKINHPSIIKFIFYSPKDFKNKYKPTIITEYAPNDSLEHLIKNEKQEKSVKYLSDTRKLIIIYGIASAMSYLHKHDIIHRDLKPANILLDKFMHPKISDFGLSKLNKSDKNSSFIESKNNCIKGTPGYMAPEVMANGQYSKASDVYAFALILYEILTLIDPYYGFDYFKILGSLARCERPEFKSSINESYKNLIERCWDQDPLLRPTFDQIVSELKSNVSFLTKNVEKVKFLEYVKYIDGVKTKYDQSKNNFYRITLQSEEDDKLIKDILITPRLYPYKEFHKLQTTESRNLVIEAEHDADKQFILAQRLIESQYEFSLNLYLGMKYLKMAKKGGCIDAIIYHCRLILQGKYLPRDFEKLKKILDKHLKEKDFCMYSVLYGKLLLKEEKYDEALKHFILNQIEEFHFITFKNDESIYEYAKMLYYGKGIKMDKSQAFKFFQLIMEQYPRALVKLGRILINDSNKIMQGIDLIKGALDLDYTKAYYYYAYFLEKVLKEKYYSYYKVPADRGDPISMIYYSSFLSNNDNQKKREEEIKYIKKAADKGHVYAIFRYGYLLYFGIGVEANPIEGSKYIKIGADNGNIRAMQYYGDILAKNGDNEEAFKYYQMGIEHGDSDCMTNYALYLHKEGYDHIDKVIELYEAAIAKGNSNAMNNYAYMLQHGQGVPVDTQRAIKLYKMAIEKGNLKAKNNYAIMLNTGEGDLTDKKQAREYYKLAADSDMPEGMFNYAHMLFNGDENDREEALYYYKKAADKDDIEAIISYGNILLDGDGIEKNPEKAAEYFKRGMELGDSRAFYYFADMLYDGLLESEGGKTEAAEYFKQSADLGCVNAMARYASMLYSNDGVSYDRDEILKYFKMAADGGEVKSMANYAFIMLKNDDIPNNKKEAAKYYQMAAEHGDTRAMFRCGELFHDGTGVPVDKKKALQYFKLAADNGDLTSMNNYAYMLYNGDGIPQDKEEAMKYYKIAADNGNEVAISNYLDILLKDETFANKELAAKYAKNAADNGDPQSMFRYGELLKDGIGVTQDKLAAYRYFVKASKEGHDLAAAYCGFMLYRGDGVPMDKGLAQIFFEKAKKNGLQVQIDGVDN